MKSKIPDLYTTEDEDPDMMTGSGQEKAETIGKKISSVFTNEPEGTWEFLDKPEIRHSLNINITEDKLLKKLQELKISKSAGPDGVHPRILNELQVVIAKPLTMIFCTSVNTGTLPQAWKEANISAIFKKGCNHVSGNYRAVSLTSIACKLVESFKRDALIQYIKDNHLISRKQFGFLTGRSTVLQLLQVMDKWTEILDTGGCVDVVYCDFQKAFDTVPHRRLLTVLEYYGITDPVLSWVKDFLSERGQ